MSEWAKQGKESAKKELASIRHPENLLFWRAFGILSASRTHDRMQIQSKTGVTVKSIPNPIPISEILAYCDLIAMSDIGQRLRLLSAMQAMDVAYRKFASKS